MDKFSMYQLEIVFVTGYTWTSEPHDDPTFGGYFAMLQATERSTLSAPLSDFAWAGGGYSPYDSVKNGAILLNKKAIAFARVVEVEPIEEAGSPYAGPCVCLHSARMHIKATKQCIHKGCTCTEYSPRDVATVYECPQCGPDPAGAERHAETHHTI